MQDTHQNAIDAMPDLSRRGMVSQCTDVAAVSASMLRGPLTLYAGFDATAPGLHAGHLVVLTALRRLAAAGHRVIVLLGGATTMIGDPSFRTDGRPLLSQDEVRANMAAIRRDAERVLRGFDVTFADNAEWTAEVGFLDFMREVGSKFTVARMSAMESMRSRVGNGVTMMEFSYMMLQAWDFVQLNRRHGCVLQVGGSDQWGNICNGVDLARRIDGTELHGLTVPLLTGSNGRKMGKTASGVAWLAPERMPPGDFWQFWRNVDDVDVVRFLLMFSEETDVDGLSREDPNALKTKLADILTDAVHGRGWRERERPVEIAVDLDGDGTVGLLRTLVAAGLAATNSAARRLVEGGGCRIDGETVTDSALRLKPGGAPFLLSVGRKKSRMVLVVLPHRRFALSSPAPILEGKTEEDEVSPCAGSLP